MKTQIFLRHLKRVLIGALLCFSIFHIYDLNHHRHVEIEQRSTTFKNSGISVMSNGVNNGGLAQVIELPTTDGVYTNDIEANFQQALIRTLGEVIIAYLLLILLFSGIKQIMRIRIDHISSNKTKA